MRCFSVDSLPPIKTQRDFQNVGMNLKKEKERKEKEEEEKEGEKKKGRK